MTQTVIGVFDTPDSAYAAGDALVEQGVDESAIYFSAKEGGAAGSGLKGQPMSAIRSFLSELFSENTQDADYYAKEIERGSVLLSVDVPDDTDAGTICHVIEDAGGQDMETLPDKSETEASGEEASGGEASGEEASGEEEESGERASGERGETLPVIEEKTQIGKQQVGKGKTRIVSRMVETPVREQVNLKEERATIKRRRVDQPMNPEEVDELEGASIEVEETTEKPVISKRARIVEEVELGKETSERVETVEDTERHTEIDVEREPAPGAGPKKKGGRK